VRIQQRVEANDKTDPFGFNPSDGRSGMRGKTALARSTGFRPTSLLLAFLFCMFLFPVMTGCQSTSPSSSSTNSQSSTSTTPTTKAANYTIFRYDQSRSGLNPNESILTTSNVNPSKFGKLFSYSVDEAIFAQPLYLANLAIPGKGTHNVIFVETANDSVYAFDADSNAGSNASPLWQASMLDAAHGAAPGAARVTSSITACNDMPSTGITGTPAIDVSSGTMYLEASSVENGSVVHRLHALDITTGAEKPPGPVLVMPSVNGTGDGSSNNTITLNPLYEYNKTALLLLNGTLYISFGSHCDYSPFHGWLLAYDASSFALTGVFNATPNGGLGGVWISGGGIAADSNSNLYFTTGNGTYDGAAASDFGDSVMKLGTPSNGTFPILDWFTPFNQANLSSIDFDQGSGGVLLLPDEPGAPHPHLLITGGKDGTLYVLNRDNMGQFNANSNSQVWQSLPGALTGIWSTPAFWNNNVYLAGSGDIGQGGDPLKAYAFDASTGKLSGVPSSSSPETFVFPPPDPVVSTNGSSGTAIVWAVQQDSYASGGPAILRAYDATNLANELYSSSGSQNATRDNPGPASKFSFPLVANGKVYVGTQGGLSVFGNLQ
jgi:hypothetical protein